MAQSVRWILLGADGAVTKGAGQPNGLGTLARASVGGAILVSGFPPLFVSGQVALIWAVEVIRETGEEASRIWGLEPGPLRRLWLMPGIGIGIGRERDDVEAVVNATRSRLLG